MLLLDASVLLVAAIACAGMGIALARSRRRIAAREAEMARLATLLQQAQEESRRLKSLLSKTQSMVRRGAAGSLARIESLAEPAALDDSQSLARAAAELPSPHFAGAGGPFAENRQSVAIARLADEGLTAAQIAECLGVSVGEVELRLSLGPP